jgi:hypothetical protein
MTIVVGKKHHRKGLSKALMRAMFEDFMISPVTIMFL